MLRDTAALPVPRLADHIDTENGPSDEEGEKEAKHQRSEPTTPISTSSRLPYEYDEVMGITQADPREAERFEEGLDLEYHDASENPPVQEPSDSMRKSGCGSSSLRECIELLNNTERNTPVALHSGVKKEKTSDPQHGNYFRIFIPEILPRPDLLGWCQLRPQQQWTSLTWFQS